MTESKPRPGNPILFNIRTNPATDFAADLLPRAPEKTDDERKKLIQVLQHFPTQFSTYRNSLNDIIDFLFEIRVEAGDIVFQQGDPGNYFYIIDSGDFYVIRDGEVIQECQGKGTFGILSLKYCENINYSTLKARTDGRLWILDSRAACRYIERQRYLKQMAQQIYLKEKMKRIVCCVTQ